MYHLTSLLALFTFWGFGLSRDVPENINALYCRTAGSFQCMANEMVGYLPSLDSSEDTFSYCGDHRHDYGIIYIQGMNKHLADMDISCKGIHEGSANDGRCDTPGAPGSTSFCETVRSYNKSISDLNPYVHPYVVFGNDGSTRHLDPRQFGIEPLSVMAVVCNGKLIYGVWGDQRHDSGAQALIGEASLSLATACYGGSMSFGNGHRDTDVLYIGFNGTEAVPGPDGAEWDATSYEEFEASIETIGDKLIARI